MSQDFSIQVYGKGHMFQEGLAANDTLKALYSFSDIYSYCIEESNKKLARGKQFIVKPELRIGHVKQGSLDSLLFIDFPAAYAMIGSLVNHQAWDLFKQTFQFVKASIELIKAKNESPRVVVTNSPGAVVIVAGGNITVPETVFDIAKRKLDSIANFAEPVRLGAASFLDVKKVGSDNNILDEVSVDRENSAYYSFKPIEYVTDEEHELSCSVYKFNKKSLLGSLEIQDNGVPRPFNFEAKEEVAAACVEAMQRETVKVKAKYKMQVNAFGETKIIYMYLNGLDFSA